MRYSIIKTSNGYMIEDTATNDYLHDESGNNCFDERTQAQELVAKAKREENATLNLWNT
jgi:hypothetical protein